MPRRPVYVSPVSGERPSPFDLTRDDWLRREPRDSIPRTESFKQGREFRRLCSQCREYVLTTLEQEPIRTIHLWQRLSEFAPARAYVLDALLTEGKIVIVANGVFYYSKSPKHWYYLTRTLPKDLWTKMVPYKLSQQQDS